MISRGIQFTRDERWDSMGEPGFANLVISSRVQKLRKLIPTASDEEEESSRQQDSVSAMRRSEVS